MSVDTAGATSDNIKVFCRVRPMLSTSARRSVTTVEDDKRVIVGAKHSFTFDFAADQGATQEAVFDVVGKPLADAVLDG